MPGSYALRDCSKTHYNQHLREAELPFKPVQVTENLPHCKQQAILCYLLGSGLVIKVDFVGVLAEFTLWSGKETRDEHLRGVI